MRFNSILAIGLFATLIGGLGVVGVIPIGSITGNSVTFSTPTVTCSSGTCTATVQVTNNGETNQYSVYFTIINSLGQQVKFYSQPEQPTPATYTATQAITGLSTGSYTLNVFAVDVSGVGVSPTVSTVFNTGSFSLTINPTSAGTVTPPAGTTIVNAGSTVTLSFVAFSGWTFSGWFIACDNNPNNPLQPTSNPYVLTVNGNCVVTVQTTLASGTYVVVTPAIFGQLNPPQGSISPSTAQTIYSTSSQGQTSVTFTETANTGYSFSGWQIYGTTISGTSPSITITYAQLQPYLSAGQVNFQLTATFTIQPLLIIQVNNVAAITTTPAPGTYPYSVGQQVTVTETTSSGYCFAGWLLTQGSGPTQNLGKGSSVTITIVNGGNALQASGFLTTSGFCNAPPPGTTGIPILSWALLLGGITLTGYGAVRRRDG